MEQRVLNKRQLDQHADDIQGNRVQVPETVALMRVAERRNIKGAFRDKIVIRQTNGAPRDEEHQQKQQKMGEML